MEAERDFSPIPDKKKKKRSFKLQKGKTNSDADLVVDSEESMRISPGKIRLPHAQHDASLTGLLEAEESRDDFKLGRPIEEKVLVREEETERNKTETNRADELCEPQSEVDKERSLHEEEPVEDNEDEQPDEVKEEVEPEIVQTREKLPAQKKNRGFKLSIPQIGSESVQKQTKEPNENKQDGDGKGFLDFFSPRGGKKEKVVPMVVEEEEVKIEPFLHGLNNQPEQNAEDDNEANEFF